MDYGRRKPASPSKSYITFMTEVTDQYMKSIGGIHPVDFKRPYMYEDYTSMMYLNDSPLKQLGGIPPTLEGSGSSYIPSPYNPLPFPRPTPWIPPKAPLPTPFPIPEPWVPPPYIPPDIPVPPYAPITDEPGVDRDDYRRDCCYGAHIAYAVWQMECGETSEFHVSGMDSKLKCDSSKYMWVLSPAQGSLVVSGFTATYTAPACGPGCSYPTIFLYCGGKVIDSFTIIVGPPCPNSASISYTTQQMAVGEQQSLTAIEGAGGCGAPYYTWAITSGGGTLSKTEYMETVYTAPATNENCEQNPVITLSCNGAVMDTLQIAVNAVTTSYSASALAYSVDASTQCQWDSGHRMTWNVLVKTFDCSGNVVMGDTLRTSCGSICPNGWPNRLCREGEEGYPYTGPCCGGYCEDVGVGTQQNEACAIAKCESGDCGTVNGIAVLFGVTDVRTAAHKLAGCCPAELL